jgi:uncharacterized protein YpmB
MKMTKKTQAVKTETPAPALNATALIAQANSKVGAKVKAAAKPTQTKEERAAERAKRYPSAAKAEAEAKVTKGTEKTEKVKKSPPPAKEIVKFVAQVMKPGSTVYALRLGKRPSNGVRMFAHTHAALAFLGMLGDSRPAVPEAQLVAFLGQTAVTYHKAQHNLESAPNQGIRLAQGSKLLARAIDGKLANGFLSVFQTGKPNPDAGVDAGDAYSVAF